MKSNYLNAFFGACAGIVLSSNATSAELLSPVNVEITQGQFECLSQVAMQYFGNVPFAYEPYFEISSINRDSGLIDNFNIEAGSATHFINIFIDSEKRLYAILTHPEYEMTQPYNFNPDYGSTPEIEQRAETVIYINGNGESRVTFNEYVEGRRDELYRDHTDTERQIGESVYQHMQLCAFGGG